MQSSFLLLKYKCNKYKQCYARYTKGAGDNAVYKIDGDGKIKETAYEICKKQQHKSGYGVEQQLEYKLYRRCCDFEYYHSAHYSGYYKKNYRHSFH